MRWLEVALLELADKVAEFPGPADNPRIRDYHASTRLGASPDEIPWCASFVSWCLKTAGLITEGSPRARDWLEWGMPSPPRFGALIVLSRGANAGAGHVGFFIGQRHGFVYVLGGNQGNAISIARYEAARVIGVRWPAESDCG